MIEIPEILLVVATVLSLINILMILDRDEYKIANPIVATLLFFITMVILVIAILGV